MPTSQNVIAVIVNHEFQDQYFTNEKSFNDYAVGNDADWFCQRDRICTGK